MIEINKIYQGNALDLLKQIPDDFITITITSPPYNMGNSYRGYLYSGYNDNKKIGDYYGFIINIINELIRINKYYTF